VVFPNDNKAIQQRLAPQQDACEVLMRSFEVKRGLEA
jgi:hypothetical protein